jgi:DNA-binding GntR family transcriptional regulator
MQSFFDISNEWTMMRGVTGIPKATGSSGKLSEEAYQKIRDRILRGEFALGTPLNRRDLAEEFGISLVPISEALQRLEIDGLVETEPRKGTRVKIPTPQELKDNTVVRAALECESARLCSEVATPDERRDIVERAARLDPLRSAATSPSVQGELLYAIHAYHVEFHLQIAKAGHCEALWRLIEQNRVLVLNWVYDVAAGDETLPADFHTQLALAVVGTDPAQASEAMRAHVWWGWEKTERAFRARYWTDPKTETSRRWRAVDPLSGRA